MGFPFLPAPPNLKPRHGPPRSLPPISPCFSLRLIPPPLPVPDLHPSGVPPWNLHPQLVPLSQASSITPNRLLLTAPQLRNVQEPLALPPTAVLAGLPNALSTGCEADTRVLSFSVIPPGRQCDLPSAPTVCLKGALLSTRNDLCVAKFCHSSQFSSS